MQVQGAPASSRAPLCLGCVALANRGLLHHLGDLILQEPGFVRVEF